MATTFSVGSTAFAALKPSPAGRYALWWKPDSPKYDIKRFHPFGVNGNIIIRGGRMAQIFDLTFRYIGTEAAVTGYFETDSEAWSIAQQILTAPDGGTFARCNLNSMAPTTPPKGIGGGLMMQDYSAIFTRDG